MIRRECSGRFFWEYYVLVRPKVSVTWYKTPDFTEVHFYRSPLLPEQRVRGNTEGRPLQKTLTRKTDRAVSVPSGFEWRGRGGTV
jgi:hypothetical protein